MIMDRAKNGHVDSIRILGHMYALVGDLENADLWFSKLTEESYDDEFNFIGVIFSLLGAHDEKYVQKSVKYFERGLEFGSMNAPFNLGRYYINSQREKAVRLFEIAYEREHPQALEAIEKCSRGDMSEFIIKKLEKLVQDGDGPAANTLAVEYSKGTSGPRDVSKARKYYEIGATRGQPYSMFALGNILSRDENPDYQRMLSLYRESASLGYDRALLEIGKMYYNGELEEDYAKAKKYFVLASKKGFMLTANSSLYVLEMLSGNVEQAISYLEKAFNLGWIPHAEVLSKLPNNEEVAANYRKIAKEEKQLIDLMQKRFMVTASTQEEITESLKEEISRILEKKLN